MTKGPPEDKSTLCARLGEYSVDGITIPSPPVVLATNVHFDPGIDYDYTELDDKILTEQTPRLDRSFRYGAISTPTVEALASAIARLEGGAGAVLTPSGQSAIFVTLTHLCQSRRPLLVVDSLTYSTKQLIEAMSRRLDFPIIWLVPGAAGKFQFRPRDLERACGLFIEVPGGFAFDLPDFPALIDAAKTAGVPVVFDNTWASSIFFNPLSLGADYVLLSLGKLCGGPYGVGAGAVTAAAGDELRPIKSLAALLGMNVSADVANRLSYGIATLNLRARSQDLSTRKLLEALKGMPNLRLFHPALVGHAGNAVWRELFSGAASLFTVCFDGLCHEKLKNGLRSLRHFRAALGWGGISSCYRIFVPEGWRQNPEATFPPGSASVRFYIGQENTEDLAADLYAAISELQD